jgi:hypothetical protein
LRSYDGNKRKPAARLGTSTPVAARIFLICSSTLERFAAGLGQSVPFMKTGFQTPLVTSAEK